MSQATPTPTPTATAPQVPGDPAPPYEVVDLPYGTVERPTRKYPGGSCGDILSPDEIAVWAYASALRDQRDAKDAIIREMVRAMKNLGAKSDLLGIVCSYGETLSDQHVLEGLQDWNGFGPVTPEKPPDPATAGGQPNQQPPGRRDGRGRR